MKAIGIVAALSALLTAGNAFAQASYPDKPLRILVETARSHDIGTASILPSRQAAWQVGGVLIALAAAASLLEPLGFRLTMLLFIAGLLFALGARSPFAILLTALAGSFGVFHVFFYWLKVPLPIGALGL